uniref:Uncharacterized protein n=1 Tax=Clastoptera arizonana TaxID=38151 RepID=A0A1B6DUV5_9HEMI
MNLKLLIVLAFFWTMGMTMIVLACALPQYNVWWPLFVLIFHIVTLLPLLLAQRRSSIMKAGTRDFIIFITTGFIISSMGLPIVLARAPVKPQPTIQWGACGLTLAGNIDDYISSKG